MFGNNGNDKGIVSMTERERQKRLAPMRLVEAYWRGLCGAEQVPLRSQIDPRGMEDALEYAFLMERIAPSMAKIRVAGSHLSDLMGMQMAGMPFSSLIAPSDRERLGQGVARLFADPAILKVGLRAEGGFGKPALEGDLLILPLRSDFGDVTRALGVMLSHGRIGRTPRRFEITTMESTPALQPGVVKPSKPLTDDAVIPQANRRKVPTSKIPGLSETPTPFEGKKRPHLRLIVSNDD